MAEYTNLDELQLQSLKAQYEAQNAGATASRLQELVDCVNALKIQVGFLGGRGTGVSTLVQALVQKPGPRVADPWAYLREPSPSTKEAVAHLHPTYPNLTLVDLPGFEASEKPAAYLKRLGDLGKYGCVVVVVGPDGVRDGHLQVLRAIRQKGKAFLVARTKIDLDLHTAERRLRARFNPAEQLGLIRKGLSETLAKEKMDPKKVFLVSGLEPERYEFVRFEDSLEGEVLNLKRNHDGDLDDLTVSRKKVKELYKICESKSLSKIPFALHVALKDHTQIQLNVAVIGEAGSGRSSLINALRGVGCGDPEAAPTGVVEATKKAVRYPLPTVPLLYLWDLPGVGVVEGDVGYLDLSRYDFFLLVASERYKHTHSCLARAIYSAGKEAFFVRNKIDVDVEARPGSQQVPKDVLQDQVRRNCEEALKKDGVDFPQVFLVSCLRRDAYDLALLQKALESQAPRLKSKALRRAVPTVVSRLVRRKANLLMKDVWGKALQISLVMVENPQPSVAESVAVNIGRFCVDFGLDEAALASTAPVVGKDVQQLRGEIRSVFAKPLDLEHVSSLITKPVSFAAWAWGYVPYWGKSVKAEPTVSFASIYELLKRVVVELSEDAERVLLKAYAED